MSDEVASDSEDEKRIRAADNRAVRKSSPSLNFPKLKLLWIFCPIQ
jgi:hypothetical protein